MSHVDPDIVSSVLADIEAEYGKIAKTTITRGKIHKYLGMTINYSLKNHGISLGIKKILTNGEGPIRDTKPETFNTGR